MNAFVALVLASLILGVSTGMEPALIGKKFLEGVGNVLGLIAVVIGLGTIVGKLLAESGGAQVVATTIIRAFGERRLDWAMTVIGFVIGLPVFFAVGLVLLLPILFAVVAEAKVSLLRLGVPLLAGLSVSHCLVPPHPGPMAAIQLLNADVGKTIVYGIAIGFPMALLGGPIFTRLLRRLPDVQPPSVMVSSSHAGRKSVPGFGATLFVIVLPIALMLLASLATVAFDRESVLRRWMEFAGHPVTALLAAVLVAFLVFGTARGFTREQVLQFSNDSVAPIAIVLVVVGAGGGFSQVLIASGVGDALGELAKQSNAPPMLLGWLVAAAFRVATGSATVAVTAASGVMAPILKHFPDANAELLVIAAGAGSMTLSHVNDGGFWLVKEYFNLTVQDTVRTWTVMVTLVSVATAAAVTVLDWVL